MKLFNKPTNEITLEDITAYYYKKYRMLKRTSKQIQEIAEAEEQDFIDSQNKIRS